MSAAASNAEDLARAEREETRKAIQAEQALKETAIRDQKFALQAQVNEFQFDHRHAVLISDPPNKVNPWEVAQEPTEEQVEQLQQMTTAQGQGESARFRRVSGWPRLFWIPSTPPPHPR
jgi:hypothetical protein